MLRESLERGLAGLRCTVNKSSPKFAQIFERPKGLACFQQMGAGHVSVTWMLFASRSRHVWILDDSQKHGAGPEVWDAAVWRGWVSKWFEMTTYITQREVRDKRLREGGNINWGTKTRDYGKIIHKGPNNKTQCTGRTHTRRYYK